MRNPHFARYMLREASAVFLAGYAVMMPARQASAAPPHN